MVDFIHLHILQFSISCKKGVGDGGQYLKAKRFMLCESLKIKCMKKQWIFHLSQTVLFPTANMDYRRCVGTFVLLWQTG